MTALLFGTAAFGSGARPGTATPSGSSKPSEVISTTTTPTTLPETTTTTVPVSPPSTTVPPPAPAPAPAQQAPAPEASPNPAPEPSNYGCAAALAYLSANANPEFTFECPGYADGHEAMTCVNIAGLCSGQHVIAINDPCAAAYMNEAYNSNSWSDDLGEFTRPIDPYGSC